MIEDLRVLRAFAAVAGELNFRRAAEQLHMSQPPLSRMISSLEETVGAPLFARSTRRVSLTPAGELFQVYAREVLHAAAAAGRRFRHSLATADRPLTIGATAAAWSAGFGTAVSRFRRQHRQSRLAVEHMGTADQIESLLSGKIDAGFVLPPVSHKSLVSVPFTSTRMRLAIAETHPLADSRKPVSLEAFSAETFILHERSEDPGMYECILRCCTQAGFKPKVRVKKRNEHCMALVTTGAGVHFSVASPGCLQSSGVKLLRLAGGAPRLEIALVWRRDDTSPLLHQFLEAARAGTEPTGTAADAPAGRAKTKGAG